MSKLIFDQDTQIGYEKTPIAPVMPNIEKVLVCAMRNNHLLVSSTYYAPDVASVKFPETCIVDEELCYNVPITRHGMDMNLIRDCYRVNFEHIKGDIWDVEFGQPDNFMTYLRNYDVDTVYIIGNNFQGNIIDTYVGLHLTKYKVVIVTDAVNNYTDFVKDKLETFAERFGDLRFLTTEEAIGELSE